MNEIRMTFKDAKCPVIYADAPQVNYWCLGDGVMHVQFRATHLIDPAAGGEMLPVVEVIMPLPVFFGMLNGAKDQAAQLEKQVSRPSR